MGSREYVDSGVHLSKLIGTKRLIDACIYCKYAVVNTGLEVNPFFF